MLKTERTTLRIAEQSDLKQIVEFYNLNKPYFAKYYPKLSDNFYSETYQSETIKMQDNPFKSPKNINFWIFKKETNTIIGYVKLGEIIRGFFQSCFLSYAVAHKFQNFGFATESILAVEAFAFTHLNLHRIEANIIPSNKASIKVIEKCGFEAEGISKKYLLINGFWQDHIHFVKLNDNL